MTLALARRVSMFVINDLRLDSRVRREAASLAAAGYDVTVYGVLSDATAAVPAEAVDGYRIVRVPMLVRPAKEHMAGTSVASGTTARSGQPPRTGSGLSRRALTAAFVATRPMLGGTLHFLANWQLRWRPWSRRVLAQVEPSGVWHAHDLNTLPLALACADRFGGAVVYDSHELFTEAGATSRLPGVVRAILRRLERGWARRAGAVITVNDSIASVLHERLARDDIRVIRNCAEPPASPSSPLRDRIGAAPGERVVLYHGSVTFGRGLEPLIAAFDDRRLDGLRLVIMGYGPMRSTIEALAASSRASARIHVLPPVPPNELTTWVAGADVAAMPIEPTTMNHRLCSPNKLYEAIAAGVPVVGPRFVEFERVVTDGAYGPLGVLHADHRPTTIASAIHALTSLPDAELAAYRERCRRAATSRWSWGREADALLAAYASVASPARAAAAGLPATPFAELES